MPAVTVDLVKDQAGEREKIRSTDIRYFTQICFSTKFCFLLLNGHITGRTMIYIFSTLFQINLKLHTNSLIKKQYCPDFSLFICTITSRTLMLLWDQKKKKKKWEAARTSEFRACFHDVVMKEGKNTICDYKYSKRYKYSKQDGFTLP